MNAEFNEPPLANNPLPEAVRHFGQQQEDFFERVKMVVDNPLNRQIIMSCKESTLSAGQAFNDVIQAIAVDEELSHQERARSIATWYFETENDRLDYFKKLAPAADYDEGDGTFDNVVENIHDCFEGGLTPEEIGAEVTNNYLTSLAIDLEELFDTASPSRKTRAILTAKKVGEEVMEVGKIAAGVAIGTLVARRVLGRIK